MKQQNGSHGCSSYNRNIFVVTQRFKDLKMRLWAEMHIGLKTYKICKYFHLQALCGCSSILYTTSLAFFLFFFFSLCVCVGGGVKFELLRAQLCCFALYQWEVGKTASWGNVYIYIHLCHKCRPCHRQKAGHESAALTALVSRLSNVHF